MKHISLSYVPGAIQGAVDSRLGIQCTKPGGGVHTSRLNEMRMKHTQKTSMENLDPDIAKDLEGLKSVFSKRP